MVGQSRELPATTPCGHIGAVKNPCLMSAIPEEVRSLSLNRLKEPAASRRQFWRRRATSFGVMLDPFAPNLAVT